MCHYFSATQSLYTVIVQCQDSDMDDLYRSQFRLPYPLYEKLKAHADKSGRSVNAELVARLEQSFYEAPLSGLSIEDVIKVSHQVIKSLYTDFVPRSEIQSGSAKPPRRTRTKPQSKE